MVCKAVEQGAGEALGSENQVFALLGNRRELKEYFPVTVKLFADRLGVAPELPKRPSNR